MSCWELAKKDLRLQLRDRRSLFILLVLPICFISILGLTTERLLSLGDEARKFKIAVVDESNTELSRTIIASLEAEPGLVITHSDLDSARRAVSGKEIDAALIIGPTFADRVAQLDAQSAVQLLTGASAPTAATLDLHLEIRGDLTAAGRNIEHTVLGISLRTITAEVLETSPAPAAEPTATIPVDDQAADNDVYQQLVPSYTVMFVFFLVNIMGRSFIHERDLGTLRRLRAAPIRPVSLLLGKTLPFLIVSLVQSSLLFLGGRLLFGMSWGSTPWMLLPLIACTSLAATSLGLLIATLVRTDSQVSAYGNLVVILMAGISGCFMPREWLPETMAQVSLVTPHAWALIGYGELLKSAEPELGIVWQSCAALLGFAGVYFVLGMMRFGRVD